MTEKQPYVVTARAGRRVSGERPVDGKVMLTAEQAAEPLRRGEIVRDGAELSKAFTEDSETLAALRARPAAPQKVAPAAPGRKRKTSSKALETAVEAKSEGAA